MATDPRLLRPSDLCRLLNSTPLGEVISQPQLQHHRIRAGFRIGEGRHVDLLRYTAWLAQTRHVKKASSYGQSSVVVDLVEAALGAAALAGQEQKLTSHQEALLAALLTEPNHAAAAGKAGVGRTTLYRWMQQSAFRAAYRQARRDMVESAIGRIQAATGQAFETLLTVARQGRRDGDKVRAAVAILDHACRGLAEGDGPHEGTTTLNTNDIVALLGARLRKLDQSALSTSEKSRLSATLADALLRAISVDVLDKRLEALHSVLLTRKDKKQ